MKKNLLAPALILLALAAAHAPAGAQKQPKPWTEWSRKETDKILNDSGWGQTQTDTDTSEMVFQPTQVGISPRREAEGANNQAVNVKYRIRFLSAKPMRQAIARSILLAQKEPTTEAVERLRKFADGRFYDWVVVAVTVETDDKKYSGKVFQDFAGSVTETLKNNTYLERADGVRVFLAEYQSPKPDGLGAKFVFPRNHEGKPFLTPESGTVRFYSEVGKAVKLNMRFKVSNMLYEGALEY